MAISIESALGGMLGGFGMYEVGGREKNLAYCWLLRIGGPHPISEAALRGGGGRQPNDYYCFQGLIN
jgi:hypothetical protein